MLLLHAKLADFGEVAVEWPYRALSEYDLRAADVAVISRDRWDAMDEDDNLRGAPDLVVEVKSPSNTRQQLSELVSLCLEHGSREVWIVEPEKKSVAVYRSGQPVAIYAPGDAVPLAAFGSDTLPIDDIFNESSRR
jgi:Uma2 family endonuclease